MARLDEAKNVDLDKEARELAMEAEQLRQDGQARAARRDTTDDDDEKLSSSIRKLRRIAER